MAKSGTNGRGGIVILAAALIVVAGIAVTVPTTCTADTTSAPKPAPPATTAAATAPVTFATTTMTLKGKAFTMEVADTDVKTQRGLMYRESMPEDHGMLFVMSRNDVWAFWMKNTRIALDIIFVDRGGKVVMIDHRKPMDETSHGPSTPVQYVIELNGGMAEKIGLREGESVEIPAKFRKD